MQKKVREAKLGSVLNLPEGVYWLGDSKIFSNQLYLRPCYFELLEAKEKHFELQKMLTTVVYTGTPGIGKSHLYAFVVARELIAGRVVYFERAAIVRNQVPLCYALNLATNVQQLDSLSILQHVSSKEEGVYIVDGGPPDPYCPILETQAFASLSKALYVGKEKCWPYLYLHTPLFTLDEMEDCRKSIQVFSDKVNENMMKEWFLIAGGVAKAVLEQSSEGLKLSECQADARAKIGNMDVE